MALDKNHAMKIGILFVYFCILAYILWTYKIGYVILPILVLSSIAWFLYEYSRGVKQTVLNAAFEIGLFLMLFDFIVENVGAFFGLWQVGTSALFVSFVPIEIMALCLIGGTAWALAQPKKFGKMDTALDIALFSMFGTLGEFLLIKNGIMSYSGGWTSLHAFLGYFITWCLLHYLRYRVVPVVIK